MALCDWLVPRDDSNLGTLYTLPHFPLVFALRTIASRPNNAQGTRNSVPGKLVDNLNLESVPFHLFLARYVAFQGLAT
jgi:hypothetical protein